LKRPNIALAVITAVLVIILAIVYVRVVAPPRGAPSMVATADNRDYFGVVHELLTGASKSIDVIIYQGRFYFQYPLSTSNTLVSDLADAAARGVKVRAILEEADWNPGNSEDNHDLWNILSQAGVETYFDPIGTTSHSKLVVVDNKYAVVGSMNWSYYALDKNNEASTVIESDKVAGDFDKYFDKVLATSSGQYGLPAKYLGAADVPAGKGRTVFIKDVADSGRYFPDRKEGLIYLGAIVVRADGDALDEVLAVDSLFFSKVAGDTVRVFGEREKGEKQGIHALDLETAKTVVEMSQAFTAERSALRAKTFSRPTLEWTKASRVIPIPNEKYIPELLKLIKSAKQRVWVAMLDARYYDKRPVPAEHDTPRPKGAPPSLSNLILEELRDASRRGVDVRVVCDMGRGGTAPNSKIAFLRDIQGAGGKAYQDSPDVTTHAKVAIIDNDFTVVGSTNWTQPAVEENNETAVVIESPDINVHYAKFIDEIIAAGAPFDAAAVKPGDRD
jgi:phosphatidylserine/phosphatidylglycerophosphate/cardiolipin synthase-like enzyme